MSYIKYSRAYSRPKFNRLLYSSVRHVTCYGVMMHVYVMFQCQYIKLFTYSHQPTNITRTYITLQFTKVNQLLRELLYGTLNCTARKRRKVVLLRSAVGGCLETRLGLETFVTISQCLIPGLGMWRLDTKSPRP